MLGKALLSASVSASAAPGAYVEDVFSTYLYTGNDSPQTITNGIDLAGEGGLVWLKNRSVTSSHRLVDTVRGALSTLFSDGASAAVSRTAPAADVDSFTSTGFVAGYFGSTGGHNWASWTFRKAEKFFDVVTYTGNGVAGRTVAHSLGSVPGVVIIKRTDAVNPWHVWHRSATSPESNWWHNYLLLNSTNAAASWTTGLLSQPTSSNIELGNGSNVNASGGTYVAYLFAHDAGGFGDAGTDNAISCGSVTSTAGGTIPTVDLGFEPQWILYKNATSAWNWEIWDNMRGWSISSNGNATANALKPNLSDAESSGTTAFTPTATGFYSNANFGASQTFIYIAIRRGPMRAPTSGTEVFAASTAAAGTLFATGITSLDAAFIVNRTINGGSRSFFSRLAASRGLDPTSTATEANYGTAISWDLNNAFYQSAIGSSVQWLFRRAPGFFDVVCTEGSGATPQTHNLGAAPEMMIVKFRNGADWWYVYHKDMGTNYGIQLQATDAKSTSAGIWNNTAPTSTQFVANIGSATTYVAYLFASAPGVSKVGSYTGTGTTLSIDCGFTAGARFVLIKRTDSTGDWYVWDTARGIIAGNDPYLLLNSTAAEVTGTDYIDPLSSGFQISSTAPAAINASGGAYIFLAIA
jgi:hypothetical protein